MTIPKSKWREVVLQMLCNLDCTGSLGEAACSEFMSKLKITKKQFFVARDFAISLFKEKGRLDRKITGYTTLSSISFIERNILRLAFFTLEQGDTDIAVVVSEILRLSKKFAEPSRIVFIQAIINREFQKLFHAN